MIRRKLVTRRNRRKLDPSQLAPSTDAVATPSIVATNVQIDFNIPVVINDILQMNVNGHLPVSQVINSPTRVTLDFAASVIATNPWSIPAKDPAIRTSTGGFVGAANGIF